MRLAPILTMAGIGAIVGVAATGFPKRIGVSRSEAAIALPGDLLLPEADFVTNRSVHIDSDAFAVWDILSQIVHEDDDMRIELADEGKALVLVSTPIDEDERGTIKDADATWAFVILPEAEGGVRLHLRERHQPHAALARAACWVDATLTASITMKILRDIKSLAEGTRS